MLNLTNKKIKTIFLFLLLSISFISNAQPETTPPCISGGFVSSVGYGFGLGFMLDSCQYIEPWQDVYLPCHGALNRHPGFFRLNVLQDTTYTLQMSTNTSPDLMVWSIWDGCPFTNGELVASLMCGGWDCIHYTNNSFQAVITLPAGMYWMWMGLFSDGLTCNGGEVGGLMSIGGECPEPPVPPVPFDCPTVIINLDGTTVSYCGEQSYEYISPLPCGVGTNYITVQFTTDGEPYPIHLWSESTFADFPENPINIPDIGIIDGCDGNLLYYSGNFSCQFGSNISPPAPPLNEFTLMLNLPAGTYIAIIGYWGNAGNPYTIEGCIEYTFGEIGFLDLENQTEPIINQPNTQQQTQEYQPRYRKIVIQGKGFFIQDTYTGELYDIMTRKIVD